MVEDRKSGVGIQGRRVKTGVWGEVSGSYSPRVGPYPERGPPLTHSSLSRSPTGGVRTSSRDATPGDSGSLGPTWRSCTRAYSRSTSDPSRAGVRYVWSAKGAPSIRYSVSRALVKTSLRKSEERSAARGSGDDGGREALRLSASAARAPR